jgi:hypothetical protein
MDTPDFWCIAGAWLMEYLCQPEGKSQQKVLMVWITLQNRLKKAKLNNKDRIII